MTTFRTIKMFDLANAPLELREADDLAPLRPRRTDYEPTVMELQVGRFETPCDGPPEDCITREVTYAEYRLHRWLAEHGAEPGEKVLLMWSEQQQDHV